MRLLSLLLLPLLLPVLAALTPPARAQEPFATCRFTTECFEAEPCTETDFSFTISHHDELGFLIRTDAEDIAGLVFDNYFPDATSALIGTTDTAYHMLTIAPGGAARYSVHMEGPMMVSYAGRCEGMN